MHDNDRDLEARRSVITGFGAAAAGLGSAFGLTLGLGDGLFWGALIGSVLGGMPQFAQSGAVLTRRENVVLNTLVGILGAVVLLGLIVALATLLGNLFS